MVNNRSTDVMAVFKYASGTFTSQKIISNFYKNKKIKKMNLKAYL